MYFAIHGHTAAELIVERANHQKEHMGLTTWVDAPNGKIKKSDVTVAKNYLSETEIGQLNRMVSAEIAKLHAETEFEKYRVIQDKLFVSDFDKYIY